MVLPDPQGPRLSSARQPAISVSVSVSVSVPVPVPAHGKTLQRPNVWQFLGHRGADSRWRHRLRDLLWEKAETWLVRTVQNR
jgi:hypothetical protein